MTTITVDTDKDIKFSKIHFDSLDELHEEVLRLHHERFELSDAHKRILDEREKELDNSDTKGIPWEQALASIKR